MSGKQKEAILTGAELVRDRVPGFDHYPFSLPAIRSMELLPFHRAVTFFIGENGSGKSTLLEGIAVGLGLNPEGGSKNFNFSTRSSESSLADYLRLRRTRNARDSWFLRAESYFNVATEIENIQREAGGDLLKWYGGTSLHEQSHGESFLALFRHRFGGGGLYLLDEPEAALSPMRQMAFLSVMHELVLKGSQFIIATHSPIIMSYPEAWIYEFGAGGVGRVAYDNTEHVRVTRDFLNNPNRSLRILLDREARGGG